MKQNVFAQLTQADEENTTRDKIIEAALVEIEAKGISKMSLEGVAKRAKVNRVTIYRYFDNRENLQAATALKEGKRMVAALLDATNGVQQPEQLLMEGFVAALRFTREHPVIKRTAQFEPELLIEAALANHSALLRVGANLMAETIRWIQGHGQATHLNAKSAGDTLARLFSSFVLLPGGDHQITDDKSARKYAKQTLVPMVFGPQPGEMHK